MKRKSLDEDICSIARALDVIGDWWSLLIIRNAMGGFTRFSEFQQHLGIAKNTLTVRLKSLVDHDLMRLVPAQDGSKYEEYKLTKKAEQLLPVLVALSQWGRTHLFEPGEACSYPVDVKKKKPFAKLKVRASDGREVQLSDLAISNLFSKDDLLKNS